ncbi:hypothetical protein TNCV_2381251 [Trichonephila clavipes]|nr:hypothetical protein TNCV_2381251 [Trichonephila clavipes]
MQYICEVDDATRYCKPPLRWLRREAEGNDSDGKGSGRRDIRTQQKKLRSQEKQTHIKRQRIKTGGLPHFNGGISNARFNDGIRNDVSS